MKAIVQYEYGSPEVLELEELANPAVEDNDVLVRVQAAAINPLDWRKMRGLPYFVRMGNGLLKPKNRVPGVDVAGQVEAVGKNVTQFRPGDEVFGLCKGAFAEYACGGEDRLMPKPAKLTFEAGCGRTPRGAHRPPGSSRSRTDKAEAEGLDRWCLRRRGNIRRPDCQIVRSGCDRCVQHEERGRGPIDRRGPRH